MQKISFLDRLKISLATPMPSAYALITLWAALMFSKALMSIAAVTALIFWIVWRLEKNDWRLNVDSGVLRILIAYLCWVCLSVFWSDARPQSFKGIQKTGEYILIFLLVCDVFRSLDVLKKWEKYFIWISLIVIADGWFQYFTGKDLIRGFPVQLSGAGVRLSACFNTYGLFAAYLISTLPLLAALAIRFWREKNKVFTALSSTAFFLSLPLIYLTRSRGAILAVFFGLLILLIYKRKFAYLFTALLISGSALFILPKNVIFHWDLQRKDQSLVERCYLWDRALHVIKAKPLTGTGINTYSVAHQKYDKTNNWRVQNYYAHNGYLQMTAELGIPGLFLFLLFLTQLFQTAFRNLKEGARSLTFGEGFPLLGISLGIFNFLLLTFVDTILHNPPSIKLFWYLSALVFAYVPGRLPKINLALH